MKAMRSWMGMVVLAAAAATGCGDAGDVEGYEDVAEGDVGGEDPGELEVGEASQAIWKDAWNGSCAQTLSLRTAPNGGYACGYSMTWGTALWVYDVQGSWAHVYVGNGLCGGMYGWVLKDYVSRNCLFG